MATVGGFTTQYSSWRWIFWIVSIADVVVQILATLFLRETFAPKILHNKAKRLIKKTGNKAYHTEWEDPDRTLSKILSENMVRPFVMLFTQPTVQVNALYRAYLYGIMYLV
jgi:MFS family permease